MNKYAILHCHSDSSLLDGCAKPVQIAKRVQELELPACAITDHGNLSASLSFIKACKDKEIKPILGIEFYLCFNDPQKKDKDNRKLSHIVLLSKNLRGWKQLIKLVSESNKEENFYYKPRLDIQKMSEFIDGNIVGICGHLGSYLSYFEDPTEEAIKLQSIFGKGNFFLEVQLIDKEHCPQMQTLASVIRNVSKKTGICTVATPDAHYCRKEDAIDQRVLLCTNLNTTFQDINKKLAKNEDVGLATFFQSNNYHIPSYEEMVGVGHTKEELKNTLRIADMCEEYDFTSSPKLPRFNCPNNLSSSEYMKELCRGGWKKLSSKIHHIIKNSDYTKQDYADRFKEEFNTLSEIGLSDYFLIVHDIIEYAKRENIYRGAGRGSVGGSLIAYLLGITEVDPIEYKLSFSRFYNRGRNTEDHISMPDIDMDFEMLGRERIISYLREKYGHNNVAQMITFGRMQGRAALKDVLRAWSSCSFQEMNDITDPIPNEAEISDQLQLMKEADKESGGDGEASIIMWALENNAKELKQWAYLDDDGNIQGPLAKRFEQAIRLEGTKRSQGKHAAGLIISTDPLEEVCPLTYDASTKERIVGLDMNDVEKLGLIKFDLLGINLLDKLHCIVDLLEEN